MFLLSIFDYPIITKIVLFILSFSLLVIIHELGHFLAAKLFKCKVEKFYLFFNPWFSIFKKKIKETEYGIGWIPLGGYVTISGMMDERMDKKALKKPPQPWEYRTKKSWQRLIIILGGIMFNLILALIIYIGIAYVWGDTYISNQNLKYGIHSTKWTENVGIQDGDVVIKVGNVPINKPSDISQAFLFESPSSLEVLRNGDTTTLYFNEDGLTEITDYLAQRQNPLLLFPYRMPAIIADTTNRLNLVEGKLLPNDKIISINDSSTQFYYDFESYKRQFKNQVIKIGVERNSVKTYALVKTDTNANIGIINKSYVDVLGVTTKKYSFLQSISVGFYKSIKTVKDYIKAIYALFTSKHIKVKDNLGSIVTIASIFPDSWNWLSFWSLTGFFSVMLAILNLLPIPALDGGHAMFILYELITNKKPNPKTMEYAQLVGMVTLITLTIYAFGLDIGRFLG